MDSSEVWKKSQGLSLSFNSRLGDINITFLDHMIWEPECFDSYIYIASELMGKCRECRESRPFKDHFCHRKGNVPIDWFSASDLVLIGCIDLVWVIAKSFTWREDLACRFSCYWHGALEASHLFRSLHNLLLLSCPYKKM